MLHTAGPHRSPAAAAATARLPGLRCRNAAFLQREVIRGSQQEPWRPNSLTHSLTPSLPQGQSEELGGTDGFGCGKMSHSLCCDQNLASFGRNSEQTRPLLAVPHDDALLQPSHQQQQRQLLLFIQACVKYETFLYAHYLGLRSSRSVQEMAL